MKQEILINHDTLSTLTLDHTYSSLLILEAVSLNFCQCFNIFIILL